MKKLCMALLCALATFTAFGQELLQCVNPDVVNGLIFRGRSDLRMTLTATVPEALADVEAPAGFMLVGTAARGGGTGATVAYRTARARGEAYAALLEALGAAGWESEALMRPTSQIFTLADGDTFATLCRDGARLLVRVMDIDGTRYPTVNVLGQEPRPRACNAEDRELAAIQARMSLLTEGAPTLQFPPGTRSASPDGTLDTGGGSSGGNFSTAVEILSADPPAELLDHFTRQMNRVLSVAL